MSVEVKCDRCKNWIAAKDNRLGKYDLCDGCYAVVRSFIEYPSDKYQGLDPVQRKKEKAE